MAVYRQAGFSTRWWTARPLRRAIERELVDPLSRFIASQMLTSGEVVEVELDSNELTFYRRPRSDEKLAV